MSNRSVQAIIKGYLYQFDHTIVQILSANTPQSSILVEGIEDIDLSNGNETTFIQCKYYESTEYNHSVIKKAVAQMLTHFHSKGALGNQKFRYLIYGHYKGGQGKLPCKYDIEFLKRRFLTYAQNNNPKELHVELGIDDKQLTNFCDLLTINLHAPSYDEQQNLVVNLLVSNISNCKTDDAKEFYYPSAITLVQKLAIQTEVSKRTVTKRDFISALDRKDIVFNRWLQQKFGNERYAKLIKRKYFNFPYLRVPKVARIFAIEVAGEFNLSKISALLGKIGNCFSHREHVRTPQEDRFCPYILLRKIDQRELIALKNSLLNHGVIFKDGYPFNGSDFSPRLLAQSPTKDNLIKLKFIPEENKIHPIVSSIENSAVEIFDFFKETPIDVSCVPEGVIHHTIKIDSVYFINEAL